MEFAGYDGKIEVLDNAIRIKKGKKDVGRVISMSDILSVTLVKPMLSVAGCIHIQLPGAKTYGIAANGTNYATDINAICFRRPQFEEAARFKEELDKLIAASKAPAAPQQNDYNPINDLRMLKQLVDEGVITQEDFDKKKAQILGI